MTWHSLRETRNLLSEFDTDNVRDLFALSLFLRFAFIPEGYEPSDELVAAIALTPDTEAFLTAEPSLVQAFSEKTLRLAGLTSFYHHLLLVDCNRTNTEALVGAVGEDIKQGRILLPYRFGRLLYDSFNDTAPPTRTEHLEYEEALTLLTGTPQGVYQIGRLITGPMGIVRSPENRYCPPPARLPLWHCSDTGCGALHQVAFQDSQSGIASARRRLEALQFEQFGPASEWSRPLGELCGPPKLHGKRRFYDLPAVLAEALVEEEREVLTNALLSSASASIMREVISSGVGTRAAKGPPSDVVRNISDAARIQLMLTIKDADLIRTLDRQIAAGSVRIPLYDTREAMATPPKSGGSELPTQLATFGVRSKHSRPLIQLTAAIWEAYSESNNLNELGWKLRKRATKPPRSALAEYMHRVSPADALRELVLSSMPVALWLSERFLVELQPETDAQLLTDRLLWKLGFSPPRHEHEYRELRDRIQQFSDTLLRVGAVKTERDREGIRAVGVNLFVSVEYFLEQLVSYVVWILGSDHFMNRFAYNRAEALQSVSAILGGSVVSGDVEVRWDSSGGNSLGTLLTYLQRAGGWAKGLLTADRSGVQRPVEDFPHFIDSSEVLFRFAHVQLWADADSEGLADFVNSFAAIATQLNQAALANVRNGLDHKRSAESFPTIDQMLLCVARLRDALEMADVQRFIPKTFWLRERTTDVFGRIQYRLDDYTGRPMTIFGPSMVAPQASLNFSEPILVSPGDLLADVGAELRFSVVEVSAHSVYWSNYPRRRKIPSPHTIRLESQSGSLPATDPGAA